MDRNIPKGRLKKFEKRRRHVARRREYLLRTFSHFVIGGKLKQNSYYHKYLFLQSEKENGLYKVYANRAKQKFKPETAKWLISYNPNTLELFFNQEYDGSDFWKGSYSEISLSKEVRVHQKGNIICQFNI